MIVLLEMTDSDRDFVVCKLRAADAVDTDLT
jgi:hypothetical protein